jgi:cytoskeletal protein RodZ
MSEAQQDTLFADPIGMRLKAAREAQGMSLDDVAAKTRVPIRHLQHIENGEWDDLPATTYSVGFARAYATAVGLNASEIGAELRAQLGAAHANPTPSYYEPADPARVPPSWLAIIAIVVAALLVGGYLVWRNNAMGNVDENEVAGVVTPPADAPPEPAAEQAPPPAAAPAGGPVVLTATNDVWLRVYEAGGAKLYENTLKAGDRYEVPATAKQPQILTGRPDALRVTVGATAIPPLGLPEKTIADVSLLPADLLARTTQAPQPATPAPATPSGPAPAPAATAPAPAPR